MIDYKEKYLWERTKSNHCRLNAHVSKGDQTQTTAKKGKFPTVSS